ncbi:hypothetical protein [Streptomyces paromomycinus]|uniref:Uncharacterized protein n=1 Tax=Streptomyces paromomycinus TaxID=92743 RepID=A0A401W475_STREY|nr:hypothetical protein [Streptomyces paromomycinus]GCD44138.1 hypothetical protein GKJPGBOP_03829 [Streptomyces paromomycinus]
MGWFSRDTDDSPEGQELAAAREALASDPGSRRRLRCIDIDSPEAQANLAAQVREARAEQAYRNRRG